MIEDAQGHRLSGATPEAAAAYDEAVRAFTIVYGDALGRFDIARDAAPDFVMAYLAKAWLLALANDPVLLPTARDLVETARRLPASER